MSSPIQCYRLGTPRDERPMSDTGEVWRHGRSLSFPCPCGQRVLAINGDPEGHDATFDQDGRMTLGASCGYPAVPGLNRPKNWCHFTVADGIPTMQGDSQCPGKDLRHAG